MFHNEKGVNGSGKSNNHICLCICLTTEFQNAQSKN